MVKRELRVVSGKSLLVDFVEDPDFRRIILKDEHEPSMEVLQEAMIHSGVEMAVREMKTQCRILRISAEHKTSVRITGDISSLNWIPHFAVQFLNKMRTGRRWRKPMVQFGEKFWFHEGINSFVKCIIQGIFVGHRDRTRAISYITKSGIVRGKSWTNQKLSDAWESTNLEDLFANPWYTVITETRLTKKFITDEEGAGLILSECWSSNLQRSSVEGSTLCLRILKRTDTLEVVQVVRRLHKATKPHNDECRERIGTIIERTLTGKARMNACKDRIAETERVKETKRARVERGAGDVLMEPGNRDDEQVAVRHADASGVYIIENQHEENRMRDIQVSKRGSEAASEEQ